MISKKRYRVIKEVARSPKIDAYNEVGSITHTRYRVQERIKIPFVNLYINVYRTAKCVDKDFAVKKAVYRYKKAALMFANHELGHIKTSIVGNISPANE